MDRVAANARASILIRRLGLYRNSLVDGSSPFHLALKFQAFIRSDHSNQDTSHQSSQFISNGSSKRISLGAMN